MSRPAGQSLTVDELLGLLDREIERQKDIHTVDCRCEWCTADAERIARIEEERRQWE